MTATEPQPTARRRVSRTAVLATAGTIVALLGGLAALFDWFEARVTEPPPATIATKIERAALEPTRETLGSFMREQRLSTKGLTRWELAEPGLIFSVDVRLQGKVGDTFVLRWRLYRADGRQVPGAPYNRRIGEYTPDNQDHARRAFFWMPYPPKPGAYFARFSLLTGNGEPIDDINTRRFRIDRVPD